MSSTSTLCSRSRSHSADCTNLISFLYESLTTGSSDEAFTEYGLLAKTIEWPEDRSWVAFTLRDEAVWHDGKKISSNDVIWTFNTLIEKGHPFYKYYYGDVSEVMKVSENEVRFIFSTKFKAS